MTKVLVVTDKPFAAIAVKGIREVVEGAGYELALLEKIHGQSSIAGCCERCQCGDYP